MTTPNFSSFTSYRLQKVLKDESDGTYRVGLYKHQSGKLAVVKSYDYKRKDIFYTLLSNEAKLLTLLKKTSHASANFPEVYTVIDKANRLMVIREYIEGKSFKKETQTAKLEAFDACVTAFQQSTAVLPDDVVAELPKRTPRKILAAFPIVLMRAILKEPKKAFTMLRLAVIFIRQYLSPGAFEVSYQIAHRDLTSENLINTNGSVSVIDFETCALGEEETDIALFARFYYRELNIGTIRSYLDKKLSTLKKKRRFIRLTIFYALHFICIEPKSSEFYKEASDYLDILTNEILPYVTPARRSLAQQAQGIGLTTLSFVKNKQPGQAPVVLCYHGVGGDAWRFTVAPEEFEHQIMLLMERFTIVPLSELLKKKTPDAVSITFDDGYEDLKNNVAPILKKYDIKPTVFVIGAPERANRDELDNDKMILSLKDIKYLKNEGWEIGFHTQTHPDLKKLTTEEAVREIRDGKHETEKKLGFKLRWFAYPRGFYTKELCAIVKKAGFQAAFTVDGGAIADKKNPLMYPRISMERDLTDTQFLTLVSPAGMTFQKSFMTVLKAKSSVETRFSHA